MKRPPRRLTSEEVIEAAQRLVPVLRERAAQTDRERRVSAESFDALQRAGLLHILKPARYGGFELGLYEFAKVGMELARGCGSSGWIYSLLCEHCWFISLFPHQAQEEIWGEDSYNVAAASLMADPSRSQVERAPGGYRISGRFPFTSGSDHAQWLLLGGALHPENGHGPPDPYLFLVPKRELSMIDDWYVLGLRGTGSRSYAAHDVFVPEHRAVNRLELWEATTEGARMHPTFDLLRSPRSRITPFVSSAPTVGMALGAVEAFTALMRTVQRRSGRLLDSDVVKLQLSESAAETNAARLIVESDTRETMVHVRAGQSISDELQARLARDAAYVGLLSQRAVTRLHTALGSSGIFDGHPVQRALRDVHTAVAQASMHWESRGLGYADFVLGPRAPDPALY